MRFSKTLRQHGERLPLFHLLPPELSDWWASGWDSGGDTCRRPSTASAQVKQGDCCCLCTSLHRCKHTQTHTHTQAHEFSVTVQNPYLGYLVTGVGFLMHISKVLSAKTRALLSGGVSRLESTKPDGHTQSGWGPVLNISDQSKLLLCEF